MALLIVIASVLLISFCICYTFLRVYYHFFPKKSESVNPYIEEHLAMLQNDKDYEEYIAYLDKNNLDGVPLDKKMSKGEYEMKKQLGLIKH